MSFCILDETVKFVVEVDKILGTYRLVCAFYGVRSLLIWS
jgi:hypothetical protein